MGLAKEKPASNKLNFKELCDLRLGLLNRLSASSKSRFWKIIFEDGLEIGRKPIIWEVCEFTNLYYLTVTVVSVGQYSVCFASRQPFVFGSENGYQLPIHNR